MADQPTLRAELEEQRCVIERQQVEIRRQRHQIEMQRRRMAHFEAELEALKVTSQRAAPAISAAPRPPGNGNGRRGAGRVSHAT